MQEQEVKKLTMDDVAKELGVSKTTVSRAVSGKGRIGEETRQQPQALSTLLFETRPLISRTACA